MLKEMNNHKLKLTILQIVIICLFLVFIIFLLIPKNYILEYKVNDVKIEEEFNKSAKSYYLKFTYKDKVLDVLNEHNYIHKRRLIKSIEVIENEEKTSFCLNIESDKLNIAPLCYEADTPTSYFTSSLNSSLKKEYQNKESEIKKTYNNINIYNDSAIYFIWNYNGFYYINKDINKKIDIFNKEIYSLNFVGYTKDYLVIPNMEDDYTFNKIYVVDAKKGNLKSYEVKNDIYFESYFPGSIKNNLYIVDTKEKVMYEFNAKNGHFDKVKPRIYKKGTWQDVSINTLIAKRNSFIYNSNYEYSLENNNLYLKYNNKDIKTLISNNVTKIIKIENNIIYYLKKDKLYRYQKGIEELLLEYSEWGFNPEGSIYIF